MTGPTAPLVSPEVGGDAEDDDQHGVVDVEAVSDERENTHGSHDLRERSGSEIRSERLRLSAGSHRVRPVWTHRGVGGLLLLLVGDGRVHVDQTQEVQTQRRRQAAEQPAGSKVTVVMWSSCGAVGTSAPHRAAASSDSY